ncbi:YdgA family protein [Vibrio japonicus]|uniref:YdgA family protein n=1 Tax=Vibrio japonicus TaxID=1824638 RepID=A0ABY5LHR5_9VIBR|nr:YdgA family protein [Vibrio japonicus]UUM31554.1 YdgA family protein [Vibrio japonicus]
MHQLKKMGAIGGAISLALCWPLAVGQIGHNVINDSISQLNSQSIQAEIVQYDRGYLSSQVKTRYVITDPILAQQLALDGLPSEYVVNSQVQHGLFSLTAASVLENMDDLPLTLNTVTQLNGNTDYSLKLENWHQANDGAMMSITPSELSGHVTVLGELTYKLTIPSIEVDFNSGEKFLVSGIEGSGDGKMQSLFWLGQQEIKIGDMSLLDESQTPIVAMKNAQYRFSTSLTEVSERVNSQHIINIENVQSTQGDVDKFAMDLEFGDLDVTSFEYLVGLYKNNPQLTPEQIESAIPYIDTLFAKGFHLTMNNLSMTLEENGQFESQWRVAVPEGTENISKNPDAIIPALTGNLDTYISDELLLHYPLISEAVEEATLNEFVEKTEQGYQVKADLKEGNLVFSNGQQIPLLALLLPIMIQQ